MSRIVRKQLFEILNTLQSATDMLEGLFADASNSALIDLLTDCQNCAITMGNKIEAVYGEGTASVKALEEYCESIYLVSQSFQQESLCKEYYNNSKEQLSAVAEHMEQEIPDKKEIVFMPYKASMWDSLESVYLAAREDESCEAYVVPIPYFDRKPDKSLGEMHYEGSEYPKNIHITDWEQYNFEERCPDVIYIHNAYDDMNLVTCVHPRFFSSNLKKYTEELIYIPYFVLEEIEPDDQAKIEGMKHFCVLPGIIHADKVIIQSEKMSQIYINEYAKAFEAAGAVVVREQLKQKFLGLGSPKFDKVVNTKKEDVEVPEEWLKIIQKPDGTWKKIVFYNTSVTALLKHEEKMLTKMKNVFEIFKERQNEVALLWRPHPLIKTTIEAMRPQLWEDYAKMVEQYKAEGWGIYDDTADMDRAIALSDAYYGDHSSIVQLCQKAGMPVMVQDVWADDSSVLLSDGACLIGNTIWVVESETNSLCTINIDNAEIELVEFLGKGERKRSFFRLLEKDRKIYGFPGLGKQICRYYIDSRELELFSENTEKEIWNQYYAIERFEKSAYLFPMRASSIMKVDLENPSCIQYIHLPNKKEEEKGFFAKRFVRIENIVIIPCAGTNEVLFFDLESERCVWKQLDFCKCGIEDITSNNEKIYLLTRDQRIIETSHSFELKRELQLEEEFSFVIVCQNNIIMVPKHDNNFVKIKLDDFTLEKLSYPKENVFCEEYVKNGQVTFSDIVQNDVETILIPRFNNMLVKINKLTETINFVNWKFSEKSKSKILDEMLSTKNILSENILKLENFIVINSSKE